MNSILLLFSSLKLCLLSMKSFSFFFRLLFLFFYQVHVHLILSLRILPLHVLDFLAYLASFLVRCLPLITTWNVTSDNV
jgi:hypothetical protein